MARGRGRGHKGQHRKFTNPDELNAEKAREMRKKNWKVKQLEGDDDDDDVSDSDEQSVSGSDDDDDEDDDEASGKAKGVEGVIEVENPNRVHKRAPKTLDDAGSSQPPSEAQLSRREREELEKQRARENYQRLHAQGKTEQARADLARLALIKQQREDAAKKRDEEKRAKDAELKVKQSTKVAAVKKV